MRLWFSFVGKQTIDSLIACPIAAIGDRRQGAMGIEPTRGAPPKL
jgi:hypothetical protein